MTFPTTTWCNPWPLFVLGVLPVLGLGGSLTGQDAEQRTTAERSQSSPVSLGLPTLSPVSEEMSGPQIQRTEAAQKDAAAPAGDKKNPDKGHVVGSDLAFKASWTAQGLTFKTAHDDFLVHIGGRFSLDGAWFGAGERLQSGPGGVGRLDDAVAFRRGRLRINGTMFENINWVTEYALDSALEGQALHPGFIDVYGEITQLPLVGAFRAGHFREPFGMEALSGGNGLPLLERSSAFEAFVPFRNIGIMFFDTILDDRMTWASGIFHTNSRNSGNPIDQGDGEYASTSRLTFLPWYEEDGLRLLHVGAAYSHRAFNQDPGQDQARFRSFPGVRPGRYIFGDTGPIPADNQDLLGGELALNLGPFSLQGEYYHVWLHEASVAGIITQPTFHGMYVQATYFLTGESRVYRTTDGTLDRPRPHENFFFVRQRNTRDQPKGLGLGLGAWEVAVRYTRVNLNDPGHGINAQVLQDATLGLTWYLNPNTRMQWNYILADRDFPAAGNHGLAHIFAARLHIDF